MIIMNVEANNIICFNDFKINFSYPRKILGSIVENEHLDGYPNFRYKKFCILLGSNASGKTSLGKLFNEFSNFLITKEMSVINELVSNKHKDAQLIIDFVLDENTLYRFKYDYTIKNNEKPHFNISQVKISKNDSYENASLKLNELTNSKDNNFIEQIEKISDTSLKFCHPNTYLYEPITKESDKQTFLLILNNLLKSLDKSIKNVRFSKDDKNTYVIEFLDNSNLILQNLLIPDGLSERLSKGTKEGLSLAYIIYAIKKNVYSFNYIDERFSYIHTDIECIVLNLLNLILKDNSQLFITTHNLDVLDLNFPHHTYYFFSKDDNAKITLQCASSIVKKNTTKLRNLVENDYFNSGPSVSLIEELFDEKE